MKNFYSLHDTYYSVGVLQSSTLIEEWVYTNDVYDHRRWTLNLVFKTKALATKARDKQLKGNSCH